MDAEDSTPPSQEASLAANSSAGAKKASSTTTGGRKKISRMGGQVAGAGVTCEGSSRGKGRAPNNNNAPALSREDRKNEQIMRMIERQENLLKRREKKKQGIPVTISFSP